MKRFIFILLLFLILQVSPAQADWRWAGPKFKLVKVGTVCEGLECGIIAQRARIRIKIKRELYHAKKQGEWDHWTSLYIPDCTWYGESGTGPEYARYRYTLPNSTGSGAWGKFQFMPGTYHSRAKYHDWSPLDQEIAARREFWAHGTSPWANC